MTTRHKTRLAETLETCRPAWPDNPNILLIPQKAPTWFDIAYGYGPNKDESRPKMTENELRTEYANNVLRRFNRYVSFLNCLKQ